MALYAFARQEARSGRKLGFFTEAEQLHRRPMAWLVAGLARTAIVAVLGVSAWIGKTAISSLICPDALFGRPDGLFGGVGFHAIQNSSNPSGWRA